MVGNSDITASVVTAAVALGAAGISIYGLLIAHRLEQQRAAQTKAEKVEEVMSKYRDPLLRAAYDLQSRLWNIVAKDFLTKYFVNGTATEREYSVDSTLHVVGEYLGWVEILRREVQFLDLRDVERDRQLTERLEGISSAFFDDAMDPVFRVFRGEQRAIGEVMMTPAAHGGHEGSRECLGYASFVLRGTDPDFSRWFSKLRHDIDLMAREPGRHLERLVRLQNALIDLIDFLDPDSMRFPAGRRGRIPLSTGQVALTAQPGLSPWSATPEP
jgi:hypothetical protein